MSHMHELGLGTSLCSHETNPFVVMKDRLRFGVKFILNENGYEP